MLALDTTHTHPLVTSNIANEIRRVDANNERAYSDIYELTPFPDESGALTSAGQFLYWGTDFDPKGLADPLLSSEELRVQYLLSDIIKPCANRACA